MLTPEGFGQMMSEKHIKATLQSLNPDIHFDLAGRHDIPSMRDEWQGVWFRGKHITAMGRGKDQGGMIPEYDVWWAGTTKSNPRKRRLYIKEVGWRTTFENITRAKVPNMTKRGASFIDWGLLTSTFGIDYKQYLGSDFELELAK